MVVRREHLLLCLCSVEKPFGEADDGGGIGRVGVHGFDGTGRRARVAGGVFGPGCEMALGEGGAGRGGVGAVECVFEGDGGEGGDSDVHEGGKIGGLGGGYVDAGWRKFRCWHGGRSW